MEDSGGVYSTGGDRGVWVGLDDTFYDFNGSRGRGLVAQTTMGTTDHG